MQLESLDGSVDDLFTIHISSIQSMEEIYLTIYKKVNDILAFHYPQGLPQDRSVDVRKLAEKLHIEIIEKTLGSRRDFFSHEVMGYLECFDYKKGEYQWSIYINEEMGDLTKRYVIAHELAHYFLKDKSGNAVPYTKYCISPMIPKDSEEQICDIIASFLLMPIDMVLDLMEEYIDAHRDENIGIDKWLNYLGNEMRVSDYYTVIFYQNVRYLGGILYSNYQNKRNDSKDMIYKKNSFTKILEKIEQCQRLFR